MANPQLTTHAGTRYSPTADDALWLCRAVDAEGEPRDLVAQTLVNGFMWARESLKYRGSLAKWVRSYAQPVNPAWFPGGKLYVRSLERATNDYQLARRVARGEKRRDDYSKRTRFRVETVLAVERALSAPPKVQGAVDYARHDVQKDEPWVAFTDATEGTNRLWARPGAVGWRGYLVSGPGSAMPPGWLALLLAVALAFALFQRG